jgi:hypothetical protein
MYKFDEMFPSSLHSAGNGRGGGEHVFGTKFGNVICLCAG